MKKDDFGARLKQYEALADIELMRNLPVICRIDGKSFHTWTKGLTCPYDKDFLTLMDETTKFLIKQTHPILGYTQSDEITLLFYNYQKPKSDMIYNGRTNKINSVLASMAAAYFNSKVEEYLPAKKDKLAFFDARTFAVPSEVEAVNVLVWRQQDSTRNAIQLLGQSYFSPKELHKKSCDNIQEMLFSTHGINFNNEPSRFKRGGFFHKVLEEKTIPSKDPCRPPDAYEIVQRSVIKEWELPQLTKIENRVDVIFHGAEPQLKEIQ